MALRKEGYWDQHYEEELKNFEEVGDEGEVWFGLGLMRKINSYILESILHKNSDGQSDTSILDIGCGNSLLLVNLYRLMEKNDKTNLVKRYLGLDYSNYSVQLSEKVLASNKLDSHISVKQCNFLDLEQVTASTKGIKFDVVIDKGTLDAICLLASESDAELIKAKKAYMGSLYSASKEGTVFILASCNHTRDDLMTLFEINCPLKRKAVIEGEIETPKLKFGQKEGSLVCCLIIKFTSLCTD